MGNCCASEERADQDFNMQDKSGNRTAIKNAGVESGNHAPSQDYAEKITQMNPLNPKVKETHSRLKAYDPKLNKKFENLPELGVYKYHNGATYQGQYQNGLRTGFGTQVIIR